MKVIDAIWEKRNLGLTTVEITVENDDKLELVSEQLKSMTSDYVVVKLPVGRVDISFLLSKMRYVFIEGMNRISHNLKTVELSDDKMKTVEDTQLTPINKDDLELILKNVRTGMFTTDRIALDPYFTIDQAANRYVEWIKDEVNRESELYNVIYKHQKAGFIGVRKSGDGYHDFISGIYEGFTGKGLAICMTYRTIEEARNKGAKFLTTDISCNNIASLQSRYKCGFTVVETTYVYVKHNVGKKED